MSNMGGEEMDVRDFSKLMTPERYRKKGFLNLPERLEGAMSGEEFFRDVLGVDMDGSPQRLGDLRGVERQNAIMEQIEMGNIPSFLRRPKEVVIEGLDGIKIKTYAMPDYIAIGSDADYVRVPMTPALAQAFAKRYNLSLPTRTLVEATYQQAGKKLVAIGHYSGVDKKKNIDFGRNLDTSGYYLRHNRDIQKQLAGISAGTLVAGHKKELVISTGSSRKDNERIHFYGLYDKDGMPIQRTAGHTRDWTEYALGVRYYSQMAEVTYPDGRVKVVRLDEILCDRTDLAPVINRREWRPKDDVRLEYTRRMKEKSDGTFDPNKSYPQKVSGLNMPHGPQKYG